MTTLRIARILGIDIRIHWSLGLASGLMTAVFAQGLFASALPQSPERELWTFGLISAFLFSVSILLHELAHSLTARHFGLPVAGITLFMFDGVSKIGRPETARQECAIAIVGPLMNLALGGIFSVGFALHPLGYGAAQACMGLAAINVFLGVFNLLPGFPMDGGRVLRSVIWICVRSQLDATRILSCVTKYVALLAVVAGLVMLFVNPLVAIMVAVIGNVMRVASASSYKKLLTQAVS